MDASKLKIYIVYFHAVIINKFQTNWLQESNHYESYFCLRLIWNSFISGCENITNLSWLPTKSKLLHFSLSGCVGIPNFDFLSEYRDLQYLNLSGCTQIGNIKFLAELKDIRILSLSQCKEIDDIGVLCDMSQLEF